MAATRVMPHLYYGNMHNLQYDLYSGPLKITHNFRININLL